MTRQVDVATDPAGPALLQNRTNGATAAVESAFAEVLGDVLNDGAVSVDSHFFDELGADSLVMAHFCARVRKRPDLPSVSIRDVYRNPTIRSLAVAVAEVAPTPVGSTPPTPADVPVRASTPQYLLTGTLQLLFFLGYAYLAALTAARGYDWISEASGFVDIYLRAVAFSAAAFVAVSVAPILVKWVLVGRWKAEQIPIWSIRYVRFWIVKTLVRSNPFALLFIGSPLYVLYLKALGAKIGPGVAIFSRRVPICTDLLTIGAGTVIRRESFFQCYRARAGRIETGPVNLGRHAFVGEKTVLDIDTSLGDGAQLGHASALHTGQAVPEGERWHGSPAQRTDVNYLRVDPARCGALRQVGFCAVSLLSLVFLYLPLVEGGLYLLLTVAPSLAQLVDPALTADVVTVQGVVLGALTLSLAFFFGGVILGLLVVFTVPRLLNVFLKPDTVYPLYGFHDRVHRIIVRLTTFKFFTHLFGDSSYIVHYLRCLGYKLTPVEQTGSNFGIAVKQANPFLCSVGTGTMVADGLIVVNDELSSTSFCVSSTSIGPRNFLGNDVTYPAGGRTGDNCLLGTKAMVPLDGEVHEGTGLLGSPSFQIPRTVDRDTRFDHLRTGEALRRGLKAKNRYNLRTIGVFLGARWFSVFLVVVLDLAALELSELFGHVVMAVLFALSLVIRPFFFALFERCLTRFRTLKPTYCSIYDSYFWLHERLWKVPAYEHLHGFDGTPFKILIWRLMGVRVGKRVFDDGIHISDRTLTAIGDDCVLNNGSRIQCHSEEDATFKSDRSTLGAGCTVGVATVVFYGVTMGDGSELAPDSFLMKGEDVPANARWGGNPAVAT